MVEFSKLGLKKNILKVLSRLKFESALEVQEQVIPKIMKGKNVVFTSRTGSGKTLAYTLGFLGKINAKQGIQMIVLVPTRELCIQVGKEIEQVCELLNIKVGMLYGGRDISGDYRTTKKKINILIATPGRLIQHINEKNIKVGEVRFLVFDESDQMFDTGFYNECAYIRQRVSKDAQIILSSATISKQVHNFMNIEIKDYELFKIGSQIPTNIKQEIIRCKIPKKNDVLLDFFKQKNVNKVIIFCNTKARTSIVSKFLKEKNYKAELLNGKLEQKERINRLNLFKQGRIKILVTTDVAARGLHIEKVDFIVNYDVPSRPEFYVHRIGRTGRNDKKGLALSLVCPQDKKRFENLIRIYEIDFEDITKISP